MTNPHTPTKAGESASELEALAAKIEGNHIISGGNGPNFSMGWSMANEVSARMVREFAATTSPADRAASVVALEQLAQRIEDAQGCSPLVISVDAAKAIRAALTAPQALPTSQAERSDTERLDWLERRSHRGAGDGMNPRAVRMDFFHAWPGMHATTLPLPTIREAIDTAMRTTAAATSELSKTNQGNSDDN